MEGLISKMRNIQKSTPSSFRRRENAAAIVKAPPPGALTKGPDRKFSGLYPPLGGATSHSLSTNRRFAFPILALLAALVVGLLFLLPVGPLQAQDADGPIMYAENGMGPVATYTAVDPEMTAVKWSLKMGDTDYPDDGDFTIDPASGVLRFAKTPNYESPADMDTDNTYKVIVVATDATRQKGEKKVTVEVTNVNEDGTVKLSALQPAPGVGFSATLTDIDDIDDIDNGATDLTSGAKWQWARSRSKTSGWSDIDKATKSLYEPKDGDAGYYLRALAKYTDAQSPSGAKDDKTASMVSAYQVVGPRSDNTPPEFTDQDPDTNGVQNDEATRDVPEDAEAGRLVGDPVDAEDDDSQDKLTYTLDDGLGNFDIDRMTGQISVAKGAKFDHDGDANLIAVTQANMYTVTVIVTDPTGVPTEDEGTVLTGDQAMSDQPNAKITVTIDVTAVDEPPVFQDGNKSIAFAEDGVITEVLGVAYTAGDPEDAGATLKLGGADSGEFSFDPSNGQLMFEAQPNFEKPGSADGDNIYEVTVTATDGGGNSSDRDVKVMVTNIEEGGMVTLSRPRPRVGVSVMASLDDPDGGKANMKWQWWKTTDATLQEPPEVFANTDDEPDDSSWEKIDKATSDTYTPVAGDTPVEGDAGRWLVATVLYTDAKENPADDVDTENRDESRDKAYKVSANVVGEDTRNLPPEFVDQDDETPGTQNQTAVRNVSENTEAGMNVGNSVTAKDLDPNSDPLIYTLEGPDAGQFDVGEDDPSTPDVDEGGQIKVGDGTKLDYEASKTSYMVTVKAEDSYGDSSTIMVTIMVTPVDEPPEITGDADAMYAEKGTADVATYTAVDPEMTAVKWSLSGADAGDFDIDGGVLTFKKSPDYEAATGGGSADADVSNTYSVMVVATDATRQKGEKKVTVEVTNVNEDGTVKLSALQPAPGVGFSATLTDIDDIDDIDNVATDLTSGAKWQWARSRSKTSGWSDIDKATKSLYEPKDGDAGYYLRALAKYTDAQSPSGAKDDKTASMVSAYQVVGPRSDNTPPEFTDQDPDTNGVQNDEATRDVPEDAEAGRLVGDPVDAEDDDSQDKLTYTLDDGLGNFDIDRMTGQISVAKGAKFDHDGDANLIAVTQANMYTVTVIVTDPTGVPTEDEGTVLTGDQAMSDQPNAKITVTIDVTAVDEPPVFQDGNKSIAFAEDGVITEVLGVAYTAGDPEDAGATLKLGGADSGEFSFDPSNGQLMFEAQPNFEKPGSADGDNIYEVTVTATDGGGNSSDRDVKVMVTNIEEGGMVTLSRPRPRVGVSVMASLDDPDGGEANMKWQWWKTTDATLQEPPEVFANTDDEPDDSSWEKIDKATSDTYTPVAGDTPVEGDAGRWLVATVLYTDAKENPADDVDTENRDESRDKAYKVSANVVGEDTRNLPPEFVDQDDETPGTQNQTAVRNVSENTEAGMNVGNSVTAKDLDPNSDPLIYTLEGPDAGQFDVGEDDPSTPDVDEGGQIKVGDGTKLDYEASKTSYMVTVKAEDSYGDSSTIMVTIMVTPVDEPPEIMRAPDANVAPEFASATTSRTVAENTAAGEDIGNPVAASDANGDALTYTLGGTDAASFAIDSDTGQLMTLAALDYETKATYSVTVAASDSEGASDMITVTITVTNVEEPGMVTLWAGMDALTMAPQVGETITGAVMDPDGGVTGESWQWARTTTPAMMDSWMDIPGETNAAYTVTEGDTGYYLRVMATYTDAVGTDTAMVYSMPTMMVTAVGEMMGEVTLWAGMDALTMAPQVGETITGAVMDPDGGVTGESWQWARTTTPAMMDSWMDIPGETNAAYTVTEGDTGYYLRVMATYTDAVGTDMAMEYSMPTMMVGEAMPPGGTELERLIARYDTSGNGIDKGELFDAIDDYLFGPWDSLGYTKAGLFDLINEYLFG